MPDWAPNRRRRLPRAFRGQQQGDTRKDDEHDAEDAMAMRTPISCVRWFTEWAGCGKSTLLSILGLLDSPTSGSYWIHNDAVANLSFAERTRIRNREIGFIFQAFNLIGDLSVYENVELPLAYRGLASPERKKRVHEVLERVGMTHRRAHYPSQLSGGQQQRVAVARALVGQPAILLADEPTGNLDSKNSEAVIDLLQQLHRDGATICMVTHDPRYSSFADRTVRLFDGRVVDETAGRSAGA